MSTDLGTIGKGHNFDAVIFLGEGATVVSA
jgi:hypothetical protein